MEHGAGVQVTSAIDDSPADIPAPARALIGKRRTRRCQVTARDIRRFAQAIGDDHPRYRGDGDAGDGGALVAPPLFCQSLAHDELPLDELPGDGSPAELDVPIPARRTVGGSSEYEIYRLVTAGDTITVTTELVDVRARQGDTGLLYLVEIETRFEDQDGRPVARELATYIRRR